MTDNEWPNYTDLVNKINLKCYEDLGMKKCENFFDLSDLKY